MPSYWSETIADLGSIKEVDGLKTYVVANSKRLFNFCMEIKLLYFHGRNADCGCKSTNDYGRQIPLYSWKISLT